jgi:WD40 repeat protein
VANGKSFDVFLSYSRTDAEAVRQVQSYLREAGLATFIDRDQLPAGQPWLSALEQAIARCGAIAVFIGPTGLGTWQQREVQLALDRQALAIRGGRSFPVIPILLPKVEDPPGGFLRLQTWVDLRSDLADPSQIQSLLSGIRGHALADASSLREAFCPYRGLLAFREEDAGLFFGREKEVDELLAKLREHSTVTVVGCSGSGKSSVVYAGLIPALRRRADGRTWSILSLRPGPEPLHALVRAFDPPPADLPPFEADQRIEQQVGILRRTDGALGRRIRALLATPDERGTERLLLHVDQWEELYTQSLRASASTLREAEADVNRFIDLLLEAAQTSPCAVVLTVRADFYGELLKHGALAAALPPGQVNLGLMRREGLAAAIQEPARAVGLTVDPPLLKELLDEVSDDLGKLPLLEYALKGTWRVVPREGNRLTLNAYGQAGGIHGAVAKRANEIFARLKPTEQDAARRLFVSLVTPGEGRADTRARVSYSEQDEAIRAVVHEFSAADARLLVTGADVLAPQHIVEISHEALIREWDLLREWIKINRDALRRREHIRVRMREWQEESEDKTLLLPPGLPLEEGRKLLTDHGDVLIGEVEPFITASVAADEERLRQQAQQRRRRAFAALAALLFLTAFAIFAVLQWREAQQNAIISEEQKLRANQQSERAHTAEIEANQQAERARIAEAEAIVDRDRARSQLLAFQARRAETDRPEAVERAGALALESIEIARTIKRPPEADAVEGVRSALNRLPLQVLAHGSWILSLAALPDGRFVSGAQDGQIKLWPRSGTGEPVIFRHGNAVRSLAVLPDGRLASGGVSGEIKLWASDGAAAPVVFAQGSAVWSLAVLPDGTLASGGGNGEIKLWPKEGADSPIVLAHGRSAVSSLAVLPDGRLASGGQDGQIKLWPRSGTGEPVVLAQGSGVSGLAVLPDGRLASGGLNGQVKLWPRGSTGEPLVLVHGNGVLSLALLANGRLVSGGRDGQIKLWPKDGAGEPTVLPHGNAVPALAVLPDGRLASGAENGQIKIWPADGTGEPVVLVHGSAIRSLVVLPDLRLASGGVAHGWIKLWPKEVAGRPVLLAHGSGVWTLATLTDGRLASGGDDGRIKIWPKDDAGPPVVLRHASWLGSLVAMPDGRLASGGRDGQIKIWPKNYAGMPVVLRHGSQVTEVTSLVVLPDGRLASGGSDNQIKLWPKEGADSPVVLAHRSWVTSLAVLPDGRLASGGKDGQIKLWPKDGMGAPLVLPQGSDVSSLAVLPDGRLASGGSDGQIKLWPAHGTGEPVVLVQGSWVTSLVATPDRRLASAGNNGEIKLWTLEEEKLIAALCLRAGRNLSKDEWRHYLGSDTPWQPSCRDRPSNWRSPDP